MTEDMGCASHTSALALCRAVASEPSNPREIRHLPVRFALTMFVRAAGSLLRHHGHMTCGSLPLNWPHHRAIHCRVKSECFVLRHGSKCQPPIDFRSAQFQSSRLILTLSPLSRVPGLLRRVYQRAPRHFCERPTNALRENSRFRRQRFPRAYVRHVELSMAR